MKLRHYIILTAVVIAGVISIVNYSADKLENSNWTGPYFSSAANLNIGGKFMIDEAEVIAFKEMPHKDQYNYHFKQSDNLVYYNHNPVGFAYIIKAATTIFPFVGDIYALILLQLTVHLLLCFLIINSTKNKQFRILFILLYAINPIILRFVALDYYYFWQCIPGFLIVYLIYSPKRNIILTYLLTLLLTLATLSRLTILFVSLLTIVLLYKYIPIKHAIALTIMSIGVFFILNKPTEKNIWHTIYVGIAAYPNAYVDTLSDNEGYALYKDVTGEFLDARLGYNYYQPEVIKKYEEISKAKVIAIATENPWIFIRNAVLNSLQCFSPGYLSFNIVWLNIVLAIFGFLYLLLMLLTKQYLIVLCILLYAGTFSLYYPPIQAYLFGAYIFLVIGLYNILCYYKFITPVKEV